MNQQIIINKLNILFLFIFIVPLIFSLIYYKLFQWKKIALPIIRVIAQMYFLIFLLNVIVSINSLHWTLILWLGMILLSSIHGAGALWSFGSRITIESFWIYLMQTFATILFSSLVPLLIWYFFIFQAPGKADSFNARMWIALGGISIHSSLMAIVLSGEKFLETIRENRKKIETALALGLNLHQSFHWLFKESIQKALSPILIFFSIAGLGNIPFFMGAQMLDGQNWDTILYGQFAIMGGIFICASVSSLVIMGMLFHYYYTSFLPEKLDKNKLRKRKKIKIR